MSNRSTKLDKGDYPKTMADLEKRKTHLEERFNSRSDTRKKAEGTFFTPFKAAELLFDEFLTKWLSEYLNRNLARNQDDHIKVVNELSKIKILEPCYGNGQFLNAAISSLCRFYEKIQAKLLDNGQLSYPDNNLVNSFLENKLSFILKHNIVGIEKDPHLFELGIINVCLFFGINIFLEKEILVNFTNDDFFNYCSKNDSKNHLEEHYDIVFGNPPWGIDIDNEAVDLIVSRLKAVSGIKNKEAKDDSFVFFTIKAIDLLKAGGRIGFIIPNFFLTNPSYTAFRKFLLSRYRISNVVNLHEDLFKKVTMSSCFFTLDKIKPGNNDKINVLQQQISSSDSHESILQITQGEVKKTHLSRIPLVKNALIYKKDLRYKFGDFLKNGRGIEIGKKGLVTICPVCKSNRPMPKHSDSSFQCEQCDHLFEPRKHSKNIIIRSSDKKKDQEYYPLAIGSQIKKYTIVNPLANVIETSVKGINYKSHLLKAPKILIRKTGKGINAVVDTSGFYTVQVVYVLFFPDFKHEYKGLSLDYLCGLLNSSLMTDLYFSIFSDPKKTRFPHFIQRNLLELPVPVSPTSVIKKIENFSRKLRMKSDEINDRDLIEIDTLIDKLFHVKRN